MKVLHIILAACLMQFSFATPTLASDVPTTTTINSLFASRYWGSIVGGIFYTGGAVNFTDITQSWGNNYAFVGMINPLDTLEYDFQGGTEYYAGIGRTWSIASDVRTFVKLNTLIMYDAISQIERLDDDIILFKVRADFFPGAAITPYFEHYQWVGVSSASPPVGWFERIGVTRTQPLGVSLFKRKLSAVIDLSVGYASAGLFGTSSGLAYYRGHLSLPIQVTKSFTVTPSIVGQLPGNQAEGAAFVDGEHPFFYNIALTWKF
jgi:hypothetical protein